MNIQVVVFGVVVVVGLIVIAVVVVLVVDVDVVVVVVIAVALIVGCWLIGIIMMAAGCFLFSNQLTDNLRESVVISKFVLVTVDSSQVAVSSSNNSNKSSSEPVESDKRIHAL